MARCQYPPLKKNWDIITRWPSLKIPDIPFLKTLILKFFWHGLWIPLQGTTFSGPYLEPPSPKILCPQKTVPWINCLSVLQEEIRKEFESFQIQISHYFGKFWTKVLWCLSFLEHVSCLFHRRNLVKSFLVPRSPPDLRNTTLCWKALSFWVTR